MAEHTLTAGDLGRFTGTENWYRHGLLRGMLYTDGARHVAEAGGAYWLLDEIALAQLRHRVRVEEFQVWTLSVKESNHSASLSCGDGNGNTVYRKRIPWTDFPLAKIDLWMENDVIMLPSER